VIRRFFWFALGAGVAIFVFVKIRQALRKATPEAIGQRVTDRAVGVGASARDFTERVRAAMAEREAELRDELGLPE
jgi:NADH:ubiquinone oxidoreductase subunit D